MDLPVDSRSHPIMHAAYPSDHAPPRHWPSPPTLSQFTVVKENDSMEILKLNRSRDESTKSSPLVPGPRAPGHTPNLRRPHACASSAAADDGAAEDDERALQGYSDGPPSSSDDEESDERAGRGSADGTPSSKWSASSGTYEGSFKKRSPDHRGGSGSSVLAAAASSGGSLLQRSEAPPSQRFTAAGGAHRSATLAALSDLQSAHARPAQQQANGAPADERI